MGTMKAGTTSMGWRSFRICTALEPFDLRLQIQASRFALHSGDSLPASSSVLQAGPTNPLGKREWPLLN